MFLFIMSLQHLSRLRSHLSGLLNQLAWVRAYKYQAVADETLIPLG